MSKGVSLALAAREVVDRGLEMKVDALEEAVMHIGTELQALKVKLALSCHATDCRWICVTPLKVNETDYNWEKIKNHISGVWNSSSMSLDLDRLHGQIRTMEHSRLDFTAAGAASDFSETFSTFISAQDILSTSLSYVAVIALILMITVVPPCIGRALQQSTQELATEIHLAVLKNKQGGDAGSRCGRSRPRRGHEEKT